MKKVLFVFDRVAHYHRDMFRTLEGGLKGVGMELNLLSGQAQVGAVGRVGVAGKTIANEAKYQFKEYQLRTYTIRRQRGVMRAIVDLRPDIVVNMCHVGNLSHWNMALRKRRYGYKVVAWQCGYEYHPSRLKNALLRRFISLYDHHLAYHSNARDYALSHGARADQITVMHNTINEEKISTLPRSEARALVVEKHPEIGTRKVILFVGAVLAEKRIEIILQALDLMKRKDSVLVLVGDGAHLPTIRKLCEGRDDVVITGAIVEGVGPYFDAAELYVLPGTGGLGINEAMAHRLPIVSGFADGSADDLVVDGDNGFRLRDNTIAELAEKMVAILDNQALARRMGERSREMITGQFAFREFINRIVAELTGLAH
jgi:glycosyltransferase involved in cell wall biosynthesis